MRNLLGKLALLGMALSLGQFALSPDAVGGSREQARESVTRELPADEAGGALLDDECTKAATSEVDGTV